MGISGSIATVPDRKGGFNVIVQLAQENLRDGTKAVRALWTARSLKEMYSIQAGAVGRITRRNLKTTVELSRTVGSALRQSATLPFRKRS